MKYLKPLLLLSFLVLLTQPGCTSVVRPSISSSEFLTNEKKIPTNMALYVTDEFRNYSSSQTDIFEGRKWKLELGPATTDALRYALESRFENVALNVGRPQFPIELPEGSLVVVPTFDSVKQTGPIFVKFEKYHVTITMTVCVYDPAGLGLKKMTLTGKGDKAGSAGFGSPGHAALPEASRYAIKQLVDQILQNLMELSVK